MGRLERRVGDQHDLHVVARFEALHPVAFLVQQVGSHLDRQLRNDLGRALLARFLADDAKNGERERLDGADRADAGAAGTGVVAGLAK